MRQGLTLVALLVFLTAGPVNGQISSEGTVRGVIRDAVGGVLPGVTITAVSPTVPGTHSSVSESDGQYRLLKATTVRFAYPSRGEGQLQAPTLAQWNARVGRRFALGNRQFEIALSLLNITNRDALQEFLGGNNQIGSPNFAYGHDGTFRGQNRQAARTAQLSLHLEF